LMGRDPSSSPAEQHVDHKAATLPRPEPQNQICGICEICG
jgi:hypothetical protein